VNLCWVFGELLATGVLARMLDRTDQWAYRIPFALQWIWPLPILIGACFAPESPYWLVQKERISEARKSLLRLTSPDDTSFDLDNAIALIRLTDKIEKDNSAETSYINILKGVNLRRTEISVCVWLIQQFCGSGLMTYSTVFFQQAGLSSAYAFDMSMAMYALGALGTIASWWMMAYAGRRTLYLFGCIISFILMVIIGACGLLPEGNNSASWAIGSLLIIFTFVYDSSIGPVCYSLVAEIPSTRLKAKTIVVARSFYCAAAITINILTNYQMTPTAWDWKAKSGFFWAGTGIICCVWTYFRLPEPNGRTYGELNILFEQRVSARKFKSTHVDMAAYDGLFIEGSAVEMAETVSQVKGFKQKCEEASGNAEQL
jgi:SP family general alpha glucoside:H+ symporter-like MFS transporter